MAFQDVVRDKITSIHHFKPNSCQCQVSNRRWPVIHTNCCESIMCSHSNLWTVESTDRFQFASALDTRYLCTVWLVCFLLLLLSVQRRGKFWWVSSLDSGIDLWHFKLATSFQSFNVSTKACQCVVRDKTHKYVFTPPCIQAKSLVWTKFGIWKRRPHVAFTKCFCWCYSR